MTSQSPCKRKWTHSVNIWGWTDNNCWKSLYLCAPYGISPSSDVWMLTCMACQVRMQVIAMTVILTTAKGTSISRTSSKWRASGISGSTTHWIYTCMKFVKEDVSQSATLLHNKLFELISMLSNNVAVLRCDKIIIRIRSWHFWCEVTNSDRFPTGEFLFSIEACLNAVGAGSPILGKEGGSDEWLMGLSELLAMPLFPLEHPICLSRLMHALTRYDSRCDLRLSYFGSGWLTLRC